MSRMLARGTLALFTDDTAAFRIARQAVRQRPHDALACAELAQAAVRVGRRVLARKAIRRALRLAPTDTRVLAELFAACRQAGWMNVIRRAIVCARFRNPQDRSLLALWNRCRYEETARERQRAQRGTVPMILPFLRAI